MTIDPPDEIEQPGSTRADADRADADRPERTTDARLARLHLRTGALGLARAELETLAGRGTLDDDALLDLAEVRWRTGDLAGAGDAARAFLATGREDALGYVIGCEAAAALGRPGEARRLATRAIETADRPLDAFFAGIERCPVWPTDADRGEPAAMLFPTGPAQGGGARRPEDDRRPAVGTAGPWSAGGEPGVGARDAPADDAPARDAAAWDWAEGAGAAAGGAALVEPRLWDDDPAGLSDAEPPDAEAELRAAREALASDDPGSAGLHLALALRLDPTLALAVLEVAGRHADPGLDVVRGDALRMAGRDAEAWAAYTDAARRLRRRAGPAD